MARYLTFKMALPVLSLFLLIPFSGCKKSEAPSAPPPQVQVIAVEQRDVPVYGEVVGTVQADVNATISAQVSGYLLSRDYTEGMPVTNGQVLFQIDSRTYKAALDQAEAKVAKTKMDVERYTPLAQTQAISQQELDDAIQSNAAAVAGAEEARLNYEFCTIRSPVDGVAGLAQAQVGNLLGPGTGSLTTVEAVDPIRVYFSVSQQLLTRLMEQKVAAGGAVGVEKGSSIPLQLTLATGTVYPQSGTIRFADNQVDVRPAPSAWSANFPIPTGCWCPACLSVCGRELASTKTRCWCRNGRWRSCRAAR